MLNNRDEEEEEEKGQCDDSVPDSRFLYGSVYMKKFYLQISIHLFPVCISNTHTHMLFVQCVE